jgi:hypothetical protein
MMMRRFLWWIGFPWPMLTAVATANGWIDQSAMFFLLFGAMMIAAPLVMRAPTGVRNILERARSGNSQRG